MEYVIGRVKILWVCFWMALATLLLFVPITVAAFMSRTGNLAFTLSRAWAWIMLKVTWVRPVIRGREKIPPGKSLIIIANHQSHFDILALVTQLGLQFRWIIKKELRKVPLFGYALYASRNIFIDRSDREKALKSINEGLQRLPPGTSILFFAEGTRSPDGAIHPFKKGGFATALDMGFPIVPVTVNGSRKILPKKSAVFHAGPIEVVVGDPIDTGKYSHDTIDELMEYTRNIIISAFDPGYPGP